MKEAAIGIAGGPAAWMYAGDLTAETLCRVSARRVFKFAQMVSTSSGDAEDLAQDALERAIRGLETFDPAKGDLDAWLWRIVVNAGRDAGRIARRESVLFARLSGLWPVEQKVVDVADGFSGDELLAAVRALSPRHRAVIALRYGADLDYRHVGLALGISEAAALMTTRRAVSNLRTRLGKENVSHD
jgi:RNA polymerase sigma-70 factor (ECF subfamily)